MAELNVEFSGQAASSLNSEISKELEIAKKEYSDAMSDFEVIKNAFIVNQDIKAKFDEIHTTGTDEVTKIVNSLEQMMEGVTNISASWQDVSNEVLKALNSYTGGENK